MILSYCDIFDEKRRRRRIKATIGSDHPASSYGQAVIVLEDGGSLDLFSWTALNYRVVRANEKEIATLEKMGLI